MIYNEALRVCFDNGLNPSNVTKECLEALNRVITEVAKQTIEAGAQTVVQTTNRTGASALSPEERSNEFFAVCCMMFFALLVLSSSSPSREANLFVPHRPMGY